MKVVTNIAIPHEVYCFYQKVASHMQNCTVEDIIADALTRYAKMVSDEIVKNHNDASPNP